MSGEQPGGVPDPQVPYSPYASPSAGGFTAPASPYGAPQAGPSVAQPDAFGSPQPGVHAAPGAAAPHQYATPGYGYGYATHNPEERNSLGIWALVTGIAGFFVPIAAIAAIVLGRMGQKAADQGRATNRSMATAGFVLGIVAVVAIGAMIVLAVVIPVYLNNAPAPPGY